MKDKTEQRPVDSPLADGFGMVGLDAVHALLADVNLPAFEIDWGWFHGFGR